MAQSITIWGASYTDVPAIELPKTGGGTATFVDEDEVVSCYKGTATPSSSLGNDGDLYFKK